ncbi:Uncharacterised protein [Candidatus Norongarragalina meridionalis]|nr:Uncharacterised protein [Candidatus Norongarragalina meridionalis]
MKSDLKMLAAFVILGALEAALIASGLLPVITAYDAGNLLFTVAFDALLIYVGWMMAKPKEAAVKGATLMGGAALSLCVVGMLSKMLGGRPVLGISVPSTLWLIVVFALIVVLNAILGAVVAGVAAIAAERMKKKGKC